MGGRGEGCKCSVVSLPGTVISLGFGEALNS